MGQIVWFMYHNDSLGIIYGIEVLDCIRGFLNVQLEYVVYVKGIIEYYGRTRDIVDTCNSSRG
jgi:hypothetical protein